MSVIDDLKKHEGFRAKPYRCSEGFLTIGYGLNLDAGITRDEATMLLEHRVSVLQDVLAVRLSFWYRLTQARKDVLLNMAYNLGVAGLLGFKTTLRLVSEENYTEASKQMLKSKWAKQVGGRALWLSNKMREG